MKHGTIQNKWLKSRNWNRRSLWVTAPKSLVHVEEEKLLENYLGAQSTLRVRSLPGVSPKSPFGRILESTGGSLLIGLYTRLPLPILSGVWHTNGRSREGRILPNRRAIVLQQCGQCRRAGRMKDRWFRAQTTRSKRMSCKGQVVGCKIP